MIRKLVVFLILFSAFARLQSQDNRGFKPVTIKIGEQQTKLYNESHALIIGNINYTSWSRLPGVEKDIEAVKKALEDNGFNVIVERNLTKEGMDKAISSFISKYGNNLNNRLLIYYAGHGHTIKTGYGEELGYIVPVDAPKPNKDEAGFKNKAMAMAQIEIYAKSIESRHALFLFDACFSGSLFAMSRSAPEIINYKISQPVRQFISSGSANETVPDVSVFRKQFVTAITTNEADANKDGYLTGTELGDFLQTTVVNYSNNTQHPQYGKIRNPNLDKGDFVFVVSNHEDVTSAKTTAVATSTVTTTVSITEKKATEVATTTSTGNLQVISEISGKLYIDGAFYKEITAGNTSLFKNIQTGLRVINIKGSSNWTEKVMIISNQTTTVRAKNETGTIALYSEINGKLYVDDVFHSSITKGSTTNIKNLTAGVHSLKIEGTQIWNEKVNVIIGQTFKIKANLKITNSNTPVANVRDTSKIDSSLVVSTSKIPKNGQIWNPDGIEMVYVEGSGSGIMTTSGFYIGMYEITEAQWDAVMGSNPSVQKRGSNYPVENVSWNDVKQYISKLNRLTGRYYRLPNEKEWAYVANGGNNFYTYEYSGSNFIGDVAWYKGNSYEAKHTVGLKKANVLGVYDMTGNVWEWCEDYYNGNYSQRVIRGGSWNDNTNYSSVSYRSYTDPDRRNSNLGFRLVLLP